MADVTKTVEIIFGAKSEVGTAISGITKEFNKLDQVIQDVAAPLAKIGDSVLKADAALAALAIGGMALAIKESANFNQGFALISTSVTATGGDLNRFRGDILNYATGSVKSLADINAALYTAAQAGVKYSESIDFIRKAEELAVANHASLNTTVDLLTGTMNAYGFGLKDVAHINDVFFTSTLIGKQTIDELGTSMGQVVGIAANAGVSFEDLSAAIATLTAKGMTTETAITAVKNVITTIVSPSKQAAEAAEGLGLNFSLTSLTAKGFAGMLAEIMTKTGGSKEKMVELFSEIRAMNGVLSLTGDGMKFFNDALDRTKNSAGSSAEAYQKMVETFSNQVQTLKNIAAVTMVEIGTNLEPAAARIAGAFGDLLKGIKIGVDAGAFDPLFAALDDVSKDLATWIKGIAAAMPEALGQLDFTKLISAFNDLGRAIADYFGGLDLTKADDLASAMQTIIDIVTGLVRVTTGMADAFRPFVEVVVDFFKELAAGDEKTQEMTGKVLALAQAIQLFGSYLFAAIMAIDKYKLSMKAVFDVVGGGATLLWNVMQLLFDYIKIGFLALEKVIVAFLDDLSFGLVPGIRALSDQIDTQLGDALKSVAQNGAEADGGIAQMVAGIAKLGSEAAGTAVKVEEIPKSIAKIPATVETEWFLDATKAALAAAQAGEIIAEIPDEKSLDIVITQESFDKAGDKVKKAIPDKKEIDVELKMNLEKIKEQSDIVQKAIEWRAKIDIAQIEAAGKLAEGIVKNIGEAIKSTGDLMGDLVKSLVDTKDWGKESKISALIEAESKRREAAFKQQERLTDAQIENMKARTDAMKNGQGLIQIDGAGLQPHLEAFMFEILKAIQVRANAEGAAFLTGI